MIDALVGQPVINLPVAVALTGRVKSAVNAAIDELIGAAVVIPYPQGPATALGRPPVCSTFSAHWSLRCDLSAGAHPDRLIRRRLIHRQVRDSRS